MNRAVIGVGSNIRADENINAARKILSRDHTLINESTFERTAAVGMEGEPDFLNGAFYLETTLDRSALKVYLRGVEAKLGRERPASAESRSRTIDLDIIVFNMQVVSDDFEKYEFVARAVCEILPDITPLSPHGLPDKEDLI